MTHEHKFSSGKVRYDLVDPEAIHGLALAFTYGQDKGYEEYSWQKVPAAEYIGAYQRHMREHLKALKTNNINHAFDSESGLLHIDHAMSCLSMLRWHITQNKAVQKRLDNIDNREDAHENSDI